MTVRTGQRGVGDAGIEPPTRRPSHGHAVATPSDIATVWVDDSHPIFRRGLAACVSADGFRVAAETSDLAPAPQLDDVDVVVFEADARRLRRAITTLRGTPARLIATVPAPASAVVGDAIDAGVAAILVRSEVTPSLLVSSINGVLHGNAFMPRSVLDLLLKRAASGSRIDSSGLTERELEVLRLLADGEHARQIAGRLNFSERTVKNVIHDILMKMNCRNRVHGVAAAIRQGII